MAGSDDVSAGKRPKIATDLTGSVWTKCQTDGSSNTIKITMGSSSDVDSLDDVTDDTNRVN